MGRAKVKMELIEKEKPRNVAFKKRKDGLVRKLQEFTTLCDVDACMIIYGPKQENGAVQPEIWPPKPDKVLGMIRTYKAKKMEGSGNKTFGLNDFFQERKNKIEDEFSKLRKKNMESKYPTTVDDNMTQGQLRQFAAELSNKAEFVKSMIQILKTEQDVIMDNFGDASLIGQLYPPLHTHIPIHYPTTFDDQSSMMMPLMNGGDQFGGGSTSGADFPSFRSQDFYETASFSGARHYGQPPPPPPPLGYMVAPPLGYMLGYEDIV